MTMRHEAWCQRKTKADPTRPRQHENAVVAGDDEKIGPRQRRQNRRGSVARAAQKGSGHNRTQKPQILAQRPTLSREVATAAAQVEQPQAALKEMRAPRPQTNRRQGQYKLLICKRLAMLSKKKCERNLPANR